MAENRPHFSTLLLKDEIGLEELNDYDMLYLLKSAGATNRDRRISLKTLREWILRNEN